MERARPDEEPEQTLDRNWSELLQELRVVQTGVQLLTGFLLTLPFQQRFQALTTAQRHLYLVVVVLSATSTLLLITPVPVHRILFRQHERDVLVTLAHWCAFLGSLVLVAALVGVDTLVFDVVLGSSAAAWVAGATSGVALALWLLLPLVLRALLRPASPPRRRPGRAPR